MELRHFLPLAAAIAAALGGVHGRGLVHKDIEPANILFDRATGQVRLTGFGVSSRQPRERQGRHGSKQASSETETVIENDLFRITFTNRGAQVKSWILKKFDNETQNGPLDLVNPAAAAKFGYPLSLWTYDDSVRNKLSSALYVASSQGVQKTPTEITFEYFQ